MQARRHYLWPFFLTGTLLGLAGCHQTNPLEPTPFLPGRETIEAKAALTQPDTIKQTSATQPENKKMAAAGPSLPTVPPNSLKGLTFGPLTGGYDGDDQPGDEALVVELQPRDLANKSVPAFGNVQVIALQVSPEGTKSTLAVWQIHAEELRREWRTDAYVLMLPWKGWPVHEHIRIIARMVVQGGKTFEVEKDLNVHLPKAQPAASLLPDAPPPPPPVAPASHHDWQAQPLSEAVRLGRPVPLREGE